MPRKMWIDNKENQQLLNDLLGSDPIDKKVQSRLKNMQKARFKAREKEREKLKGDIPLSKTPSSSATSTSTGDDSLIMKRSDLRYFGTTGEPSYEEEFDGNPF